MDSLIRERKPFVFADISEFEQVDYPSAWFCAYLREETGAFLVRYLVEVFVVHGRLSVSGSGLED